MSLRISDPCLLGYSVLGVVGSIEIHEAVRSGWYRQAWLLQHIERQPLLLTLVSFHNHLVGPQWNEGARGNMARYGTSGGSGI